MKILVIGGSGFVGRAVVRALQNQGHSLSVLNRGNRLIPGTVQLIADRNVLSQVVMALNGKHFDALVDTNCYTGDQAHTLITSFGRELPPCALVISSAAVYADAAAYPPTEDQPIGGGSAWGDYGRDKTNVERIYRGAGFTSAVALRPPYICGPNNDLDREAWFFRRILAGRPLLLPGHGAAEYQFIHEDDLGAAVCTWLERRSKGFEAFNIGDPERVTSADLTALLARVAGRSVDIRLVGDAAATSRPRDWFPFRDQHCAVDPSLFSLRFGWTPAAGLEERFRQTYNHLVASSHTVADDWTPLEAEILSRLSKDGR